MQKYLRWRIHRAGWPFIAIFAVVAVALGVLYAPLGWIGAAATIWCVAFFRDPERATPRGEDLVISPADGVIQAVTRAAAPPELEMGAAPRTRISVFMNVFNVHVNRIPADGTITRLAYRPGRFFNATFDKASEFNERMSVAMRTTSGHDLAFVQIAGLIARRILCEAVPRQAVTAGERFGLIRFGSRVDLYLPDAYRPLVQVGMRAVAGETVIAIAAAPGTGIAPGIAPGPEPSVKAASVSPGPEPGPESEEGR